MGCSADALPVTGESQDCRDVEEEDGGHNVNIPSLLLSPPSGVQQLTV